MAISTRTKLKKLLDVKMKRATMKLAQQSLDKAIPARMKDFHTQLLPHHAVYNAYGNCYDLKSLSRLWKKNVDVFMEIIGQPNTRKPFSKEEVLINTSEITKIINDVRKLRKTALKEIKHLYNDEERERVISDFRENVAIKDLELEDQLIKHIFTEKQRENCRQKINNAIPDVMLDPILFELAQQPVFTPYGHYYDAVVLRQHWRGNAGVCPLTNRTLNNEDLIPAPIVNEVRALRDQTLDQINVTTKAAVIEIIMANYNDQIAIKLRAFEDQKANLADTDRQKEHLRINPENIRFWHSKPIAKADKFLAATGLKGVGSALLKITKSEKVQHNDESFYIPTGIAQAITMVKEQRTDKEAVLSTVKRSIEKQKKHNPFYIFSNRQKELFDAADITKVDLRNIKNKNK